MENSFCGNSSFWDSQLTLNSSWPHVSDCFQSTALTYVPATFLLAASLPYVPYLVSRPLSGPMPHTPLSLAKTTVSLVLVLGTIGHIIKEARYPESSVSLGAFQTEMPTTQSVAYLVARIVSTASYVLTAILVQLERRCSLISSGVLFIFWLLKLACDIVSLSTLIELKVNKKLVYLGTMIELKVNKKTCVSRHPDRTEGVRDRYLEIRVCVRDHGPGGRPAADELFHLKLHVHNRYFPGTECPETFASFPSRLTFSWLTRLILTGYRKPLTSDDLWRLNPRDSSDIVVTRFARTWRQIWTRTKRNQNATRFTYFSDRRRHTNGGMFTSVKQNGVSIDIFTSRIHITGYSLSRRQERTPLLEKDQQNRQKKKLLDPNENVPITTNRRSSCNLFKVLVKAFGWEVLVSYMCKFVADVLQFSGPFLLKGLILQVQTSTYPDWVSYVLALGLLLSSWIQTIFYHQHYHLAMTSGLRMKTALMSAVYKKSLRLDTTAQRSTTAGEVVNLMAVDCQRIQDVMSYTFMVWSIPLQIGIAVYLLWTTIGLPVVSGLALLVLLVPCNVLMAYYQGRLQRQNLEWKDKRIKMTSEVLSGIKVLKLYAWEESFQSRIMEIRHQEVLVLTKLAWINAFEFAVTIDKGVFTWDPNASFKLTGINIEIPHGMLVAVVGPVGSGKSSLLSAILGEMDRLQGNVQTSGSIAYVPQTPWIQNCSLRDNILFGTSMNQKRYNKTIRASALMQDIEFLPGGHDAEIGEKGVNLSGGQKQRVSVARAVYSAADIHIMDDPLSAVDAKVGKHIFKHVLSDTELLRNKTRIISTHAVHWLPLMDKIIVMEQGRIAEFGSYLELMRRVGTFTSFLQTNLRVALETSEEEESSFIYTHLNSDVSLDFDILSLVQEMTHKMWQHVESVTSQSEATSGDDVVSFHHSRLMKSDDNLASSSPPNTSTEERTPSMGSLSRTVGGGVGNGAVIRLTEAEATETGVVKLSVFKSYIRSIGFCTTGLILIAFGLYQASSVLANVELSRWTSDQAIMSGDISDRELTARNHGYLIVYGALGAFQALFIFIYACVASLRMVAASANLHNSMLDRVLKAPMSFFDSTPLGRIVNRFSRDIETLDNQLPNIVFMLITCVFSVAATILVICVDTPWFAAVLLPLFLGYLSVQVSRKEKIKIFRAVLAPERLEAVTRSPIFSHFSETISGCHVIRAFNAVGRFEQASLDKIDKNQVFYFAGITANRWLGVWIEVISSLVVFLSAVFCLLSPNIGAATLGLSVTYALQITQALKWLVRTMSDIETNVVSVERVEEYLHVPQEAARVTSLHPPYDWPDGGEIKVTGYSSSYKPELPPVLNNISFTINAGEKIGIVGRTGAGKSSLSLALFRLLEANKGEIIIDGIDISTMGLQGLRENLTILPQDPVLISGSLRTNLDPHRQYLDQEIWTALTMSNLHQVVSSMPAGLESEVGENGLNLSSGQRQLLCLARALLRRSRILVLDEPTSSVDLETDRHVQTTIQRCFEDCTTLTIAHRIDTILNCDRVMVLDAGQIVEFDSPKTLLENETSWFFKMAKSAGAV
ncbi:LOW QUALITY PROTEIN: multidrug resistance-associated protein 1 [Elysia marginata]|uniref:ABC-type glutathione-S-conjugate transporter n=1 Tax=Elysia marginata TaxID=1093978 RepID=A0AAV4F1Q8_9GAST|nr:LOW QUALITY PROTEIN: multidrug resistance-associated protein 1 [Elysia marginata]